MRRNTENTAFSRKGVDGVVAPFAARDFAAIDVQDLRELFAVEGYAAAPADPVIVVCLAAGLGGPAATVWARFRSTRASCNGSVMMTPEFVEF